MGVILRVPLRGAFANAVRIERELNGDGWLAIAGDHGWLHGSFNGALTDAHIVAAGYGVAVRSSAGRITP
jgi:hypothetical protein